MRSLLLASTWALVVSDGRAQSAFNPPPPPPPAASPTVGGLDTPPVQAPAAPVVSGPVAQSNPIRQSAPAASPVTPTAPTGIQPIEGGEIIARVDGQIILASDVMWQVDQLIAANRDQIPDNRLGEARRGLMRGQMMPLIDTKMLYANFRRQVPAENLPMIMDNLKEPFLESEVPRLVKMLKLKNRLELEELLRNSGTSLSDVQRQFNERMIAGEWLRQMLPKPEEVMHEDLLAYYQEHKQDFEFPAQAKWEEVMIRFDRVGNDRTAAWQAITGIGNQVWQHVSQTPGLRGPVFTQIAKQKSHGFTAQAGGQHDWTTKGALVSTEIDEALFSLKVGQLSNVIESERGFHIIRVLERKEAGCTPFTKAQSDIREILVKKQKQGLAEAQLAKLRKKSRVWTVFDGHLTAEQLAKPSGSVRR